MTAPPRKASGRALAGPPTRAASVVGGLGVVPERKEVGSRKAAAEWGRGTKRRERGARPRRGRPATEKPRTAPPRKASGRALAGPPTRAASVVRALAMVATVMPT